MTPLDPPPAPSLDLTVVVSRLPRSEPMTIDFASTPAEREALSRFLDLVSIDRLSATLTAERRAGDIVEVRGRLRAAVIHASVVSLDPVPQTIDEPVEFRFIEATPRRARGRDDAPAEIVVDLDDDPPDPYTGGVIPLGDALRELLSLSLDPYPKGGERFVATEPVQEESERPVSPFAALSRLRRDDPDA